MPSGGRRVLLEASLGGSGGVGRGGWVFKVVAGAGAGRREPTGVLCPLGRGLASLRCLLMRGYWGAVAFWFGWDGARPGARRGGGVRPGGATSGC